MTARLEVRDVSVRYGGLVAVDGVSLTLPAGTLLAVTGPSGAGKTSLLWAMAGALAPDRGQVLLDGTPVGSRPDAAARGVVLAPQGNGLAAVLTARENIVVPLLAQRFTAADAAQRAHEALTTVGLDDWGDHLVEELSGGQAQRVAVARALASGPQLLLADEATSELDAGNRGIVLGALRDLADGGAAVVLATHDPEAAAVADAELALDEGVATWVRPL